MTYLEFLKTKIERAPASGFEADPAALSPALKSHQRDETISLFDLMGVWG